MKMKQLLTLLLTGILFVTTCCSCGNSSATADSDSKQADTTDEASTADETSAADTQDTTKTSDEKKSLSLLFTKNAISMPIKEMKTITDTEELCNVDLEIIEVPDEGADEKINLMINTGDLPDVFMEGVSASTILNYQGQDVFIPVTEYITPEIMPNLYSILEKKPEYRAAMTAPDGEIWGFPYIEEMFGLVCNQGILSINTDWLDALGLDMPTTIDEYKECLIAFRDNDCNSNGDPSDEIPLMFRIGESSIGSWRNNQSIGQFFGCWGQADTGDRLALTDDGTVICTATTEAYKEGLKWFNELYKEGLLWADFALNDGAAVQAELNNEDCTVGSMVVFSIIDMIPAERRAMYSAVPYLQGPNGEYGIKDNISEMHNSVSVAITTACEDPAFASSVIDTFFEPQRSVESNWGAIGMYYVLDENGVMQWNHDVEMPDGIDTFSQLRGYCTPTRPAIVLSEYYDTVVAYPEDAADLYRDMTTVGFVEKHLNDPIIPPNMWYSSEDQEQMSLITGNLYNLIDNYNATAIIDGNIDATWDAYISGLEDAGLSTYLEIVQRNYDAYDLLLDSFLSGVEK